MSITGWIFTGISALIVLGLVALALYTAKVFGELIDEDENFNF